MKVRTKLSNAVWDVGTFTLEPYRASDGLPVGYPMVSQSYTETGGWRAEQKSREPTRAGSEDNLPMKRLDGPNSALPAEALKGFVALAWQLAARIAEANFRGLTASPNWTMDDVEAETDWAVERMEIASQDLLSREGADPDGLNWQAIWTAMETGYRDTVAALVKASGRRGREPLH